MKSVQLMESLLTEEYSFRKKVNKCLQWLKEGELSHIFVWGADSETGEGSQIRMWYNQPQDTYYGMLSTGEIRKCKAVHMVYQHIVKDYFDLYDEEGIKLVKPENSVADTLYKHLYKGDMK